MSILADKVEQFFRLIAEIDKKIVLRDEQIQLAREIADFFALEDQDLEQKERKILDLSDPDAEESNQQALTELAKFSSKPADHLRLDLKTMIREAPTGTGKSLAYLVPVVLSQSKVLISTYMKSLQEQLQQDLPLLAKQLKVVEEYALSKGIEFKAEAFNFQVLKGMSNYFCPRAFSMLKTSYEKVTKGTAAYQPQEENPLIQYYDTQNVVERINRVPEPRGFVVVKGKHKRSALGVGNEIKFSFADIREISDWIEQTTHGKDQNTPKLDVDNFPENIRLRDSRQQQFLFLNRNECDAKYCSFKKQCPYLNAVEQAKGKDILIINHALLETRSETEWLVKERNKIIVDEAHNLPDVLRDASAIQVNRQEIESLCHDIVDDLTDHKQKVRPALYVDQIMMPIEIKAHRQQADLHDLVDDQDWFQGLQEARQLASYLPDRDYLAVDRALATAKEQFTYFDEQDEAQIELQRADSYLFATIATSYSGYLLNPSYWSADMVYLPSWVRQSIFEQAEAPLSAQQTTLQTLAYIAGEDETDDEKELEASEAASSEELATSKSSKSSHRKANKSKKSASAKRNKYTPLLAGIYLQTHLTHRKSITNFLALSNHRIAQNCSWQAMQGVEDKHNPLLLKQLQFKLAPAFYEQFNFSEQHLNRVEGYSTRQLKSKSKNQDDYLLHIESSDASAEEANYTHSFAPYFHAQLAKVQKKELAEVAEAKQLLKEIETEEQEHFYFDDNPEVADLGLYFANERQEKNYWRNLKQLGEQFEARDQVYYQERQDYFQQNHSRLQQSLVKLSEQHLVPITELNDFLAAGLAKLTPQAPSKFARKEAMLSDEQLVQVKRSLQRQLRGKYATVLYLLDQLNNNWQKLENAILLFARVKRLEAKAAGDIFYDTYTTKEELWPDLVEIHQLEHLISKNKNIFRDKETPASFYARHFYQKHNGLVCKPEEIGLLIKSCAGLVNYLCDLLLPSYARREAQLASLAEGLRKEQANAERDGEEIEAENLEEGREIERELFLISLRKERLIKLQTLFNFFAYQRSHADLYQNRFGFVRTDLKEEPSQETSYGSNVSSVNFILQNLDAQDAFAQVRKNLTNYKWFMTSATMSVQGNFSRFKHALGISNYADQGLVLSPFRNSRNAGIFITKTAQGNGMRACHPDAIELILQNQGRCLWLCTSTKRVELLAETLSQKLEAKVREEVQAELRKRGEIGNRILENQLIDERRYNILWQAKDISKNFLIEQLRTKERVVLIATRSFWEGVNVTGDALSLLILDKYPNPMINAYYRTLQEIYPQGFLKDYYVPDGFIVFKQGVGRLIRSESDFGLVMILDHRLYGKGLMYRQIMTGLQQDFANYQLIDNLPEAKEFLALQHQRYLERLSQQQGEAGVDYSKYSYADLERKESDKAEQTEADFVPKENFEWHDDLSDDLFKDDNPSLAGSGKKKAKKKLFERKKSVSDLEIPF